jgi:biopolymer transport protein ExbD
MVGPEDMPVPVPKRRPTGHARLSLNLTSMIDVVFLLLIYFMVATEFRQGEEIFRMDLPDREAALRQRDPFDLDEEPLRVMVSSTGMTREACRLMIDGPYPQPAGFAELHDFLRRRQVNPHTTGGLFEPDHPIVVTPTGTTRWEHAIEAFNAAVSAGYHNVTLARPRA